MIDPALHNSNETGYPTPSNKAGCPTLAASLFLRLGWDSTVASQGGRINKARFLLDAGTAAESDAFHQLRVSRTKRYAGCSFFFPPFFSTTGPCVSTVGGGGASPIRFE